MRTELLLVYDGECGFCRFGIDVIRRFDRHGVFGFCPFGHPIAEGLLADVPEEARYEQMHLATPSGLLSGTDAAKAVLRELPFGRLASRVGIHRLYPLIVRYRWVLGRFISQSPALVSCGEATRGGAIAQGV